jgi:hypothetical protein
VTSQQPFVGNVIALELKPGPSLLELPPLNCAATPGGVGASIRRAVAVTTPLAVNQTGNFDPEVDVPQVTRPSEGSGTQMPFAPTQFVRFADSTACS